MQQRIAGDEGRLVVVARFLVYREELLLGSRGDDKAVLRQPWRNPPESRKGTRTLPRSAAIGSCATDGATLTTGSSYGAKTGSAGPVTGVATGAPAGVGVSRTVVGEARPHAPVIRASKIGMET
jgi:hypothetical protein